MGVGNDHSSLLSTPRLQTKYDISRRWPWKLVRDRETVRVRTRALGFRPAPWDNPFRNKETRGRSSTGMNCCIRGIHLRSLCSRAICATLCPTTIPSFPVVLSRHHRHHRQQRNN